MQEYYKNTTVSKSINVCVNHLLDKVSPVIFCNGWYSVVYLKCLKKVHGI